MKITYYGTAAAEAWPGVFCRCDACQRARAAGGRNIRTRSQACVDDRLLIDMPADTYLHVLNYGLDMSAIPDLIVTHTHSDHYYPNELWCRSPGIAHELPQGCEVLNIWGDAKVGAVTSDAGGRVKFNELPLMASADVGGYTVTALPADHDQNAGTRIYVISKDGKTLLYAHDTGYLRDEVWEYIGEKGLKFDFVSLDCTNCTLPWDRGHMGIDADRRVRDRLKEMGAADGNTIFCLNHFSHNGQTTYDDLVQMLGDEFMISYDGMSVEF